MYIQVTIDLRHYVNKQFDLRLSNYYSIKKVIEIVWQVERIAVRPREGGWVRVSNKEKVCHGHVTLEESGITNGDKLEIL
ncbi:ubiquitin [Alkalihalobacillus oceani]|uniref:EsaB/YukD family protein n=1 Tax=Halalkalibacter oceani TaxID=1653776 RepID=UPI00203F953C|nr:ubiquitin [Halalkalibacter oceani]